MVFLLREVELENKAIENFYQQLIGNDISDINLLKDRANLFNIQMNSPPEGYGYQNRTL